MKEFYQNLKRKREERNIGLDEIHRRTRLPMPYLKDIEAGRLENLPEGYQRLYLKRYIQEIGLDTEAVLRDYDVLTGKFTPQGESPMAPEGEGEPDTAGELPINLDAAHKYFWIAVAVLAVLAAAYFTYAYYTSEQNIQGRDIVEIPITQLVEPPQAAPANPAGTPAGQDSSLSANEGSQEMTPAEEINPEETFLVVIQALERTWIREVSGGKDTTEYILSSGTSRSVRAYQQLSLRLGRADGVSVTVNNQTRAGFGAPNQVADLLITREGISRQRILNVRTNPTGEEPAQENAAGE